MTPRFYYSDSCTCERPPFERQRQRQRQTETDRQTDRQTDNQRQIDRQTDRHTHRQTERERQRKSDRNTHRHQDTKRDNKKDRQTNRRIALCLSLSRSFRFMLGQVSHALEVKSYSMHKQVRMTSKHSMRTLNHVRHCHKHLHHQQHAVYL